MRAPIFLDIHPSRPAAIRDALAGILDRPGADPSAVAYLRLAETGRPEAVAAARCGLWLLLRRRVSDAGLRAAYNAVQAGRSGWALPAVASRCTQRVLRRVLAADTVATVRLLRGVAGVRRG